MDAIAPDILLSRVQLGVTLAFHILFPTLTIGLSALIALWEIAWLRTRDTAYYRLCRFWTKVFALAFGLGVVSGIVLSYEFGTNFSRFAELAGNVVGPVMSYEVLTAFFLEAGFLGIMLFGWERVSERVHLVATLLVALGTLLSASWILAANSWMHTPAGYEIVDGVFQVRSWREVVFNPSLPYRFTHMVIASFLTVCLFVAGISAGYLLRGEQEETARPALSLALYAVLVLAPLQLVAGDLHGLNTLAHQPIKIAAIEGRWETAKHAPFTLFAWPDALAERNSLALEIPGLGSLILTHSWQGEVVGLKSVPATERPPVAPIFFSFRLMVGLGLWFIFLAVSAQWLRLRRTLEKTRWLLRSLQLSTPLGFLAVWSGWFTTEVGRQPWVVQGLLRTSDAASRLPATEVGATLLLFIVVYGGLLAAFVFYLRRLLRSGPESIQVSRRPATLAGWLEKQE